MTRIIADISFCLDGFVTGPESSPDTGLGTGGETRHTRALSDDPDDPLVPRDATARSGAVVLTGGDATIGSALDADLVDALTLCPAPVVPGAGTPQFTGGAPRTLVQRNVISASTATHLTYDVPGVIR
ncbi:hypothetical protein ACWD0J_15330 [Streptomyces sp. NPDC003011]